MEKTQKDRADFYYHMNDYIIKEGGPSKLTVLLQKRAKELIKGLPKLIDTDSDDPVQIAMEELFAGKITLKKPEDAFLIDGESEKSKKNSSSKSGKK